MPDWTPEQLDSLLKALRQQYTVEDLAEALGLTRFLNRRSLLSNKAILEQISKGTIIIDPFDPKNLATASYDVTLGPHYWRKKPAVGQNVLNMYDESQVRAQWELHQARRAEDVQKELGIQLGKGIGLDDLIIMTYPCEMILCHTSEYIGGTGGRVTTMMKARSSMGRNAIAVCKCAGWGDVGYINRWTMEVTNYSPDQHIPLVVGRRIAQIAFFEVEPILSHTGDYTKEGKYSSSASLEELKQRWTPDEMLPKMWKDREVRKE
jgi:dCTP deaminase